MKAQIVSWENPTYGRVLLEDGREALISRDVLYDIEPLVGLELEVTAFTVYGEMGLGVQTAHLPRKSLPEPRGPSQEALDIRDLWWSRRGR